MLVNQNLEDVIPKAKLNLSMLTYGIKVKDKYKLTVIYFNQYNHKSLYTLFKN